MRSRIIFGVGLVALIAAVAAVVVWRARPQTPVIDPPVLADTAGVEPAVVALVEERLADVRADPRQRERWIALGESYHANVLNALAATCYEQALAMDDDDAKAWYHLGRARAEAGDLDGAIDAVRRSIALDPTAPQTHWHLASWLLDQGLTGEAETALADAATLAPDAPAVKIGRGRVHVQRNEPAEAAALFEDVLRRHGDLNRDYVAGLLVGVYRTLGRAADTQRIAPVTAARRPRWPDPWTDQVNRHRLLKRWVLHETDLAIRSGRPQAALEKLERVHAADPADPAIADKLAQVLYMTGRRADALALLDDAVRRNPRSAALRVNFAVACAEADRLVEAEKHMDAAVRLEPDNGSLHNQRGWVLLRLNRLDDAERCFRRSIELGSDGAMLYTRLGETLCRQGRYRDALTFLPTAILRQPSLAAAHMWLARARAETGELAAAATTLEQARALGAQGADFDETARRIEDLQRGRR